MKLSRSLISQVLVFFTLIQGVSVVAEEGASSESRSLAEWLKLAQQQHPANGVNRARVRRAELNSRQVNGEFGPRLQVRAGLGPTTEVNGNALSSVQNRDSYGVAYLASLEFTWPIYAWGRKSALRQAASFGSEVEVFEGQEAELKRDYEIKEAYFGILFAKTMVDFIEGHQKTLQELLEDLREKKKNKREIYRLEVLLSQLQIKLAEAQAALLTAEMGLAVRAGFSAGEKVGLVDQWLRPRRRKKEELQHYTKEFLRSHPKLKLINSGIAAKASLAKSEDLARWPVLAVLAKFDYTHSSVREEQQSVFAFDPYNQEELVGGIGFQWDFQFGLHSTKRDQYLAEKQELEAQQELANKGLAGLVTKAWLDLQKAELRLDAAKTGNRSAKKLWNRNAMSWAAGLSSSEDISQAFTTRALATKDYYEAIYAHELAWAALSESVGKEVDPLLVSN